MLIKKYILFTMIVILSSLFTGCWNSRDLNTMGIIGSMGIDLQNNKEVTVTVEVLDVSRIGGIGGKSEGTQISANYVQSTGKSIFEAQRYIPTKYDKKIFYPHMKCYIIGEGLAQKGLIDYIDMLNRDHELRTTIYIAIAKGSTAEDIMGIRGGIESIPSNYISSLLSLRTSNGRVLAISVSEFLKSYYSKGTVPVLGVLSKVPKVQLAAEEKFQSKYELSGQGAAIILDGKLLGYFNGEETQALSFINNKLKTGVVSFYNPTDKGVTTCEILKKTKAKNTVELKDNKIKIKVKLSVVCAIQEETGKYNLKDVNAVKELEKIASKTVEDLCKKTIKKAQYDYKADVFGFGNIVHRKYPKQWKIMQDNWNTLFSQADVEVEVKTKVITTGTATTPMNRIEGK